MGYGTNADPIQPLSSVLPGIREKSSGQPDVGMQRVIGVPLVTKTAASTTYKVGAFVAPSDGWYIKDIFIAAMVVPSYASQTIAFENYDKSATTSKNPLAATNYALEGLTALQGAEMSLSTTLSNLLMDEGDVLDVTVAIGASQTTAGEGLVATIVLVGPEID